MSVTRATVNRTENGIIKRFVVATGQSVGQGIPVTVSSDEISVATGATSEVVGVAYETEDGVWPATEGDYVDVMLLGSPCIVPVKVAAAGVTQGKAVKAASGGVVDATVGGATTVLYAIGNVIETGVSGDLVGCNLATGGPGCGS